RSFRKAKFRLISSRISAEKKNGRKKWHRYASGPLTTQEESRVKTSDRNVRPTRVSRSMPAASATLAITRLSNSPKGTYHGHAFSVQSISHPRRNLHGQNTLGPGLSFVVRNCGGSARALYRRPRLASYSGQS